MPANCPEDLVPLLEQCLLADPKQRPTIEQFTNELRALIDNLCEAEGKGAEAGKEDEYGGYNEDVDMSALGADLDI